MNMKAIAPEVYCMAASREVGSDGLMGHTHSLIALSYLFFIYLYVMSNYPLLYNFFCF